MLSLFSVVKDHAHQWHSLWIAT